MKVRHGDIAFELPPGFADQTAVQLFRETKEYPLSVTLTLDRVGEAPGPLPYLRAKLEALRPGLPEYKLVSCEAAKVGAHEAARAHFTFEAPPELSQLVVVFFAGKKLVS